MSSCASSRSFVLRMPWRTAGTALARGCGRGNRHGGVLSGIAHAAVAAALRDGAAATAAADGATAPSRRWTAPPLAMQRPVQHLRRIGRLLLRMQSLQRQKFVHAHAAALVAARLPAGHEQACWPLQQPHARLLGSAGPGTTAKAARRKSRECS